MHVLARDPSFPARLVDGRGQILAEGSATALKDKESVDFESDFVPLYPLGTSLIIERFYENKVIHRFYGEVYLSDKQLLRLTGVTDELLPGSELVYDTQTSLKAELREREEGEEPKKSFFRKGSDQGTAKTEIIMIKSISSKGIEFDSEKMLESKSRYFLTMEEPVALTDIPVYIDKVYAFGNGIGYLCKFEKAPEPLREKLDSVIRELNQKNNRIF